MNRKQKLELIAGSCVFAAIVGIIVAVWFWSQGAMLHSAITMVAVSITLGVAAITSVMGEGR